MCRWDLPNSATPLWQLVQPVVIPAWSNFVPGPLPIVPALGAATGPPATLVGAFVPEAFAGELVLVVVVGLLAAVPFGFAGTVALAVGPVVPIGARLEVG